MLFRSHPGHQYLENTLMRRGRYINERDLYEFRKVAVIGEVARESIFGNANPIGKEVSIGGIPYTIVGEFYDKGSTDEMRIVYLPITTTQKVYAGTNEVHQLMVTTGDMPLSQMQELERDIRRMLSARHQFAMQDRKAVWITNLAEEYQQFQSLFAAIRAFVWFVGIGSIIAGVIGVSNIMLIIVKDRTREIGVRKAMGATPRDIIMMVLSEAVFITALAGYAGLAAGVGVLALMSDLAVEYFRHPQINIWVGLAATLVLVVTGALAGLMPALQAARINPVEAMKAR